MTSSTRFKLLAAAGTAALVLATVGCSNDPFAKAECSEDPDVRGSNYKYECKNGFVVKVDAVAPDVCEPLTDEEQREFCKKKGTSNVIDCKKLTATSSCGAERTIDCRKFIDFNSNKKHCGQCGNSCEFPNSFASCKQGSCQITACETGETEYRNLDGKVANGCECEVTQELCNGKNDNCDDQVGLRRVGRRSVQEWNDRVQPGRNRHDVRQRVAHRRQGSLRPEGQRLRRPDRRDLQGEKGQTEPREVL
ncbi:MAG: hypothetical protein ABEL76_09375, partial [Bradymonadaceae bacterium]